MRPFGDLGTENRQRRILWRPSRYITHLTYSLRISYATSLPIARPSAGPKPLAIKTSIICNVDIVFFI